MKTVPRMRCARAAEIADFLELSSWKYTWSAEMCTFSNIEKSAKSLHSTVEAVDLYQICICKGSGPEFESSIFYNDPDVRQDHCVTL